MGRACHDDGKQAILACMKLQIGARGVTADSCFSLIGPCQCSVAQDGPATSIVDPGTKGLT